MVCLGSEYSPNLLWAAQSVLMLTDSLSLAIGGLLLPCRLARLTATLLRAPCASTRLSKAPL